jgi:hypothetical protein
MCDEDRPVYWWEEPCNWRDPDPPRHCYTCHYWLSYQGTVEPNGYAYVSTYSGSVGYCALICPARGVNATSSCPHWQADVPVISRGKQALLLDLYLSIHRVFRLCEAPGDGTLEDFAEALRSFLKGEEGGTDGQ